MKKKVRSDRDWPPAPTGRPAWDDWDEWDHERDQYREWFRSLPKATKFWLLVAPVLVIVAVVVFLTR